MILEWITRAVSRLGCQLPWQQHLPTQRAPNLTPPSFPSNAPLGFDGHADRLRALLAEARASLEAVEAAHARAARHVAAADYAMLLVGRVASDVLAPAPLTATAAPVHAMDGRRQGQLLAA